VVPVSLPTKGTVLINGLDIHKQSERIQGVIGYIPQDDLLIEDLTVHQNLFYAAKLCFNHYLEYQINELVFKVLSRLGLEDTKN